MTSDVWMRGRIIIRRQQLTSSGVLDADDAEDRRWLGVLAAMPRHLFVPERACALYADGEDRFIDRKASTEAWFNAVYTEGEVVTQRGDGRADVWDTSAPPTSSISSPRAVFRSLKLLLHDHRDVLEIGTGSGWTAVVRPGKPSAEYMFLRLPR
jgi:protein-L-isoaspartate O-methyltransferase